MKRTEKKMLNNLYQVFDSEKTRRCRIYASCLKISLFSVVLVLLLSSTLSILPIPVPDALFLITFVLGLVAGIMTVIFAILFVLTQPDINDK